MVTAASVGATATATATATVTVVAVVVVVFATAIVVVFAATAGVAGGGDGGVAGGGDGGAIVVASAISFGSIDFVGCFGCSTLLFLLVAFFRFFVVGSGVTSASCPFAFRFNVGLSFIRTKHVNIFLSNFTRCGTSILIPLITVYSNFSVDGRNGRNVLISFVGFFFSAIDVVAVGGGRDFSAADVCAFVAVVVVFVA